MKSRDKLAGELDDRVTAEALKHFKASVDAWSEAAYRRPRPAVNGTRFATAKLRLAAGWALGFALVAGGLAGGVFEHQHRQELAKLAAQKAAQKRLAAEEAAVQGALQQQASADERNAAVSDADEDLMATVDSDVSQDVPTAMEPLAQLMVNNGTN